MSSTESSSKEFFGHWPSVHCGINYWSQIPYARGFVKRTHRIIIEEINNVRSNTLIVIYKGVV